MPKHQKQKQSQSQQVEEFEESHHQNEGSIAYSSEQSHPIRKKTTQNRKYSRITPQVKDKLIFLIVRTNMSIKNAAQYLKINYSSAKFIFNQYRSKNQKSQHVSSAKNDSSCYHIRKLREGEDDGVKVRFTIGGKFEGECGQLMTAQQIYRTQHARLQNNCSSIQSKNIEKS